MIAIPNMDKPKNAFECSTKINPEERMCIYTGKVFEETLSLLLGRRGHRRGRQTVLEMYRYSLWRYKAHRLLFIRRKEKQMTIYSGHEGKDRVCCNCKHNKRMPKKTYIRCICDIDGHYIGYIEGFDCWCRHWARERRCDGNTD